jgi:hypothetical protein
MFHNLLLTGLSTTTMAQDRRLLRKRLGGCEIKLQFRLLGNRERQEEKGVKMRCSGWAKGRGGSGTFVEGF